MSERKKIAAILFDGFELLDVFGPLEAFGILSYQKTYEVITVAARLSPVASAQGPKTAPDFSFDDCPLLDMFLIPGGIGTRREVNNDLLLQWLRDRTAAAANVMSVCTGAAVLARTGLLDGRRATTNKRSFAWASGNGPKVNWVKEARWVEDGKFWTSSGVSAGIDMALAVIARVASSETAEQIATQMEYDWHRNAGWDPFARIHGLV
jgi:transcriptional regulator GlxA family with amidase domain